MAKATIAPMLTLTAITRVLDSVVGGPVVASPGQWSTGMLELTTHTLDTFRGKSWTGMVTPVDTQSSMSPISSETLALRVPWSWAW